MIFRANKTGTFLPQHTPNILCMDPLPLQLMWMVLTLSVLSSLVLRNLGMSSRCGSIHPEQKQTDHMLSCMTNSESEFLVQSLQITSCEVMGPIGTRVQTGYHCNIFKCGPKGYICSRYTTPAKCSRNKFSVHEHSDCEHCEMFSVPLRSDLKSAHISVCAVWLIVYTLRNVWGHFNVHSPCW